MIDEIILQNLLIEKESWIGFAPDTVLKKNEA